MKKIIPILLIVFTLALISCKKDRNQTVTVIKDCTGTYLRIDSKDYRVCNVITMEPFANGENVIATYTEMNECNNPENNRSACLMYHKHEGLIEVEKIRKK